jgi:hypothetical protein
VRGEGKPQRKVKEKFRAIFRAPEIPTIVPASQESALARTPDLRRNRNTPLREMSPGRGVCARSRRKLSDYVDSVFVGTSKLLPVASEPVRYPG